MEVQEVSDNESIKWCIYYFRFKYHDFFKANKITLIDIGHYESEKYTKDLFLNF